MREKCGGAMRRSFRVRHCVSSKTKRGGVAATAFQLFEEGMIRFRIMPNVVGIAYKAPPVTPLHPLAAVPAPEAGAAEITLALLGARYFAVMTDVQVDGSGLKAAF